MTEKRSERRRETRLKHRMVARFSGKTGIERGIVLNITETGFFVQSRQQILPGKPISLILGSPPETIELTGKVCWIQAEATALNIPGGMGVSLASAPAEYIQLVQKIRNLRTTDPRGIQERFEIYHPVRIQSGGTELLGFIENLSRGGIYLALAQALKPGDTIDVKMDLPSYEKPIRFTGTVKYYLDLKGAAARGRSIGAGVEFLSFAEDGREKIDQFVRRLEIHRTNTTRRYMGTIPEQGVLSEYLVPEILLGMLQQKVTGFLKLAYKGVTKTTYLKNGQPVFVHSTLRTESLGDYLMREGKLNLSEFEETLRDLESSDGRLGELLIKKGHLTPIELVDSLIRHQEEKLINSFSWFDGSFSWASTSDWPEGLSVFPLRIYRVLFDGVQRWYNAPVLTSWMGLHEGSILKLREAPPEDAILATRIHRILRRITTPQSIATLAGELKEPVSAILPIAYTLIIAGWAGIEFIRAGQTATPETAEKAPPPPSEAAIAGLKMRVEGDLERFSHLDFYELLKIQPTASAEELERAFVTAMSRYQVSSLDQLPNSDVREKALQVVSWIRLAYETLKDPKLRQTYARMGSKPAEKIRRQEKLSAERVLLRGIMELNRGDSKTAATLLNEAHKKYPDDPAIQGYLAWALFKEDPKTHLERATDFLNAALDAELADPQLLFYRGEIFGYLQNWKAAERCYSKALRLHPNFAEAASALEKAQNKRIALERMLR